MRVFAVPIASLRILISCHPADTFLALVHVEAAPPSCVRHSWRWYAVALSISSLILVFSVLTWVLTGHIGGASYLREWPYKMVMMYYFLTPCPLKLEVTSTSMIESFLVLIMLYFSPKRPWHTCCPSS